MADLERILRALDHANISRLISNNHDIAREAYPTQIPVTSYQEFRNEVMAFISWMYDRGMNWGRMPPQTAAAEARGILENAFGQYGGYVGAYEYAAVYGIRDILEAIYKTIKKKDEENFKDFVISTFVDITNWEDRVELMRQFLQRFGGLVLPGMTMPTPESLAINAETLIKYHSEILSRLHFQYRRF